MKRRASPEDIKAQAGSYKERCTDAVGEPLLPTTDYPAILLVQEIMSRSKFCVCLDPDAEYITGLKVGRQKPAWIIGSLPRGSK